MKRTLIVLILAFAAVTCYAQEIRPFVRGSKQQIVTAHQGQPFILAVWSLDCPYCRTDLELLGKVLARHNELKVVLVTTDATSQDKEIRATLKQYRLQQAESWAFNDRFTERLRYEIDPQWSGEMPRLYFFDAAGNATGLSGKIERSKIERWVKKNTSLM
jgi:thiol-disulfide isomerase/thioredoxin